MKRVGNFKLQEIIGEGSFCKVFRGISNDDDNKEAALRFISAEELNEPSNRQQLLKGEITSMQVISSAGGHRNIVKLLDIMEENDGVYIATELLQGPDLFDLIEQSDGLSETIAKSYFRQLIEGVSFCHKQGVAHRDLKPENVFITKNDDIVKIIDFSIATITQPGKNLGEYCGTYNYLAPEVLAANGYDGFKADIWSCGVILYCMLTALLPFEEEEPSELIQKIISVDYRFHPKISEDAKDLITKILIKDINERYTIDQILNHPWLQN